MTLRVRLFCDCSGDEYARSLMAEICHALAAFHPVALEPPERYWKMPELYELYIQLGSSSERDFARLIDMQPTGWTHLGDEQDRSAVWNRAEKIHFLDPRVAWAEIQYFAQAT